MFVDVKGIIQSPRPRRDDRDVGYQVIVAGMVLAWSRGRLPHGHRRHAHSEGLPSTLAKSIVSYNPGDFWERKKR
jgi:hypothetical protein